MTYDDAIKQARGIQDALKAVGVADGKYTDLGEVARNGRWRRSWSSFGDSGFPVWSKSDSWRGLSVTIKPTGALVLSGDTDVRHSLLPVKKDGALDYANVAKTLTEKRAAVERVEQERRQQRAAFNAKDADLGALIESKRALFPGARLSHDTRFSTIEVHLSKGAFLALGDRLAPRPAEAPQ